MLVLVSNAVLAFALLQVAPLPSSATATVQSRHVEARKMMLVLPHELREGEVAWLLVKVGAIDHNEIRLTTHDGHLLGAISPFGVRSGQAAGTYTVPVPAEDFHGRRLELRLSVVQSGRPPRVPTRDEVKSVRLRIEPAKH